MMTYDDAIASLEMMAKTKQFTPMYLRLERLALLFKELGIERDLPSVHIAGTSGKGSTSSLCASVFQQAGYKVGLHISPHLHTPRERMQVNGELPMPLRFASLIDRVMAAAEKVQNEHSYGGFKQNDILFTAAMLYFTEEQVDIAVIETSMGGHYDSTNVIQPLVSVVTNVDLDHTKVLGKTIEAIATVKAGVIKPETPFITGATQPSVLDIFKKRAADQNTSCIVIGEENKYRVRQLGQRGSLLSAEVIGNLFSDLHLRLLGKHQINNALMVLYIIQVLRSRGWLVSDESIRAAFSEAFLPGRLEVVQEDPIIILDGAHNPAKAKALAHSLRSIFRRKKITFVFAVKKGKNLDGTLKPLLPLAERFIVTNLPGGKGQSPAKITRRIKELGVPAVTRVRPEAAIEMAIRLNNKSGLICITGSLYLVGQLRAHWYPALAHEMMSLSDDQHNMVSGEPFAHVETARR